MDATKRQVLHRLIDMNARLLFNCMGEESDEARRKALHGLVDEDWVVALLDGVSYEALEQLAAGRLVDQACVAEVSRLFDYCCVENHVRNLLRIMVPGLGYNAHLDTVVLPDIVQLTHHSKALPECLDAAWEYMQPLVQIGSAGAWTSWAIRTFAMTMAFGDVRAIYGATPLCADKTPGELLPAE